MSMISTFECIYPNYVITKKDDVHDDKNEEEAESRHDWQLDGDYPFNT